MNREVLKLKYIAVVSDNYRYMGAVDNQISLGNDGRTKPHIGLDSEWETTCCPS